MSKSNASALAIVASTVVQDRSNSRAQFFDDIRALGRAEGTGDLSKPKFVKRVAEAALDGLLTVDAKGDDDDARAAWLAYAESKREQHAGFDMTDNARDLNTSKTIKSRASEVRTVVRAALAIPGAFFDTVALDDDGSPITVKADDGETDLPVTSPGLYERALEVIASRPTERKGTFYENLVKVMRAQTKSTDAFGNERDVRIPLTNEEIEAAVFGAEKVKTYDEEKELQEHLKNLTKTHDGVEASEKTAGRPGFPSPGLKYAIAAIEARLSEIAAEKLEAQAKDAAAASKAMAAQLAGLAALGKKK
jgi:hypothetical protein